MLSIADHFTETFHAEHREVRDLLLALIDAFKSGDAAQVGKLVETLPEDDVVHILATRDVARETDADLLTWVRTMRTRHV
ncbi:hypothetical protein AB0J28_41865 [Streptosporangium canum]|uniref:hypothetical protein n=1 Tax=Streptosporangium canum TaxID=324952 RepID=UPI00343053DA